MASTPTKKRPAKKTAAKRPAATSANVVRHGATGGTRAATATPTKLSASIGIDRTMLLKKLVQLTNSKQDAVALDATKALLAYVK